MIEPMNKDDKCKLCGHPWIMHFKYDVGVTLIVRETNAVLANILLQFCPKQHEDSTIDSPPRMIVALSKEFWKQILRVVEEG